jgi:hypothetical protein
MTNELIPVNLDQLPSTQLGDDADFADMSRSTRFLSRVQLYTRGPAIDQGLVPPGTYGIPEADGKITVLGTQIDVLPLAKRLKALDMSDREAIITNYDSHSDEFKDIAARSEERDSGCAYGTSFLVFERSSGRFLELFCGAKSTRPIAGDIAVFCPLTQADIDRKTAGGADVSKMHPHFAEPCTLKVRVAKNKRNQTWHVPEPHPCSVPFGNLPSGEVLSSEIYKFTHPAAPDVETVKEEPSKKSRAR